MNQATDNKYDTPLDSAISAALKEPMAACSLPSGFAERLVGQVKGAPARSRLPRWLRRAACFALLLSGVAFAATVVVDAVVGADSEATVERIDPNAPQTTEATDGSAALDATAEVTTVADGPYVPDI